MVLRIFFSKQFIYFLLFGGMAALTNLLVGWLLYQGDNAMLPYSLAVFIGASSGLLVNFGLNYAFNFGFRGRSMLGQFRTFFIVAAVGTLLTAMLARLFLAIMHWLGADGLTFGSQAVTDKLVAHVISVGVVTFYSFVAHKYLSFNLGIRNALASYRKKFK